MKDTELYQRVLGLAEPWFVSRVELKLKEGKVDVWVDHRLAVQWRCPRCESESKSKGPSPKEWTCYDHAEERVWRHLDTCQFQTHLHARIPRVDCPDHGILNASVPWADEHSRFTLLMEAWIIEVLRECGTTTGAAALTGLGWDAVSGIMQRAVARGLARKEEIPLTQIGVDEKAVRKGHSYMTVVCDLNRGTVEYVADGRKAESLGEFYQSLSPARRAEIEAIAMDMWEPYVQATMEHVPLASEKIVFDKFHIMKHLNEAVDEVRREEHRALSKQDDDRLKGTKHWWLYAEENVPDKHQEAFERVRDQNLRTSRAWAMKETLRDLFFYRSVTWAKKFFDRWRKWVNGSRLEPVKEVARMLQNHLPNVLTYCTHGITNAVAEGLNSKIMTIKRLARGYRTPENFKTAIYFFCGGLNLHPR